MDYDEANCPISCTGRCGLPILNTEHIFTRYKEFHVLSMQNRVDILLIRIKHWPKNVIWMVLKYEKLTAKSQKNDQRVLYDNNGQMGTNKEQIYNNKKPDRGRSFRSFSSTWRRRFHRAGPSHLAIWDRVVETNSSYHSSVPIHFVKQWISAKDKRFKVWSYTVI